VVVVLFEQREDRVLPDEVQSPVAVGFRLHEVGGADLEVAFGGGDRRVELGEQGGAVVGLVVGFAQRSRRSWTGVSSGWSSTKANLRRIAASTWAMERSAVFMVPMR
jgi:hypothetical protein